MCPSCARVNCSSSTDGTPNERKVCELAHLSGGPKIDKQHSGNSPKGKNSDGKNCISMMTRNVSATSFESSTSSLEAICQQQSGKTNLPSCKIASWLATTSPTRSVRPRAEGGGGVLGEIQGHEQQDEKCEVGKRDPPPSTVGLAWKLPALARMLRCSSAALGRTLTVMR